MIRLSNRAKKFLELMAAADCVSNNKMIERLIEQEASKRELAQEDEVTQGYRVGHRFDLSNGIELVESKVTRVIRYQGRQYHLMDNEGVALREHYSWRRTKYYVVAYKFEPGTDGTPVEADTQVSKARQAAFMRFAQRKAAEAQDTLGQLPAVLAAMTPGAVRSLVNDWCNGVKWATILSSISESSKGQIVAPVCIDYSSDYTEAQLNAIFSM